VSKLDDRSLLELRSCDPQLERLFIEVNRRYPCKVLEGFRDEQTQHKYFHSGLSKVDWPNGKHNKYPSWAADVLPTPIDWKDTKRFYHFGGYVQGVAFRMDIGIRWGGDWDMDKDLNDQSFMDLCHFELLQGSRESTNIIQA